MLKRTTLLLAVVAMFALEGFAQETKELRNKKDGGYIFTVVKDLEATEVQSQDRTGTCWSFSALSFFESELIRMGKGKHNLSEMFIVRNAYVEKVKNYVRMHGKNNLSAGGAFHDIPIVMRKYGIIPEEFYQGLEYGTQSHNHGEMNGIIKGMADAVIENSQKKLTPSWLKALDGVLDAYLGEVPEEFEYQGKKYTPESYAKELGLDMDDYVIISSFTHHPWYKQFVFEVPDNWAFGQVYNLPLDEMIQTMDHAIDKGYSMAWASDVSEKGFSFRDGLAIVPEDPSTIRTKGRDNSHFSNAGAEKLSSAFDEPVKELKITQELRQEGFDNYETTDDHGMHITGIVNDQKGTKYYIVKNSWGTNYNDCDGYFYASEAFVRYKTMNVMMHKDALPKAIAKKLGLK